MPYKPANNKIGNEWHQEENCEATIIEYFRRHKATEPCADMDIRRCPRCGAVGEIHSEFVGCVRYWQDMFRTASENEWMALVTIRAMKVGISQEEFLAHYANNPDDSGDAIDDALDEKYNRNEDENEDNEED